MNVLLIEDDENKRTQIAAFFVEVFPNAALQTARSLQSGLRMLKAQAPSVILLDMTLPNYDLGPGESGGQMHPLGGQKFLNQMERFDINIPVIVITQFETFGKGAQATDLRSLDAQLRKDHPSRYAGVVYYHAAIHGWKERLSELLADIAA